jgi:hypothetical protein
VQRRSGRSFVALCLSFARDNAFLWVRNYWGPNFIVGSILNIAKQVFVCNISNWGDWNNFA